MRSLKIALAVCFVLVFAHSLEPRILHEDVTTGVGAKTSTNAAVGLPPSPTVKPTASSSTAADVSGNLGVAGKVTPSTAGSATVPVSNKGKASLKQGVNFGKSAQATAVSGGATAGKAVGDKARNALKSAAKVGTEGGVAAKTAAEGSASTTGGIASSSAGKITKYGSSVPKATARGKATAGGSVTPNKPTIGTNPVAGGSVTPSKPTVAGSVTPAKPGFVTPNKPGLVTPTKPGLVAPNKPTVGTNPVAGGSVTPAKPGLVTPAKPGSVTPAKPGLVTPAKPGSVTPAKPVAGGKLLTPAKPNTPGTPSVAGGKTPSTPGRVNSMAGTLKTSGSVAAKPIVGGSANLKDKVGSGASTTTPKGTILTPSPLSPKLPTKPEAKPAGPSSARKVKVCYYVDQKNIPVLSKFVNDLNNGARAPK